MIWEDKRFDLALSRLMEELRDFSFFVGGVSREFYSRRVLAALLNIGPIERDPDRIREVYEIGRTEGRKRLAEVRDFLK
ncbi:MAG: hypothetical protein Q4D17_11385 [Planctomycetia bacterium]|nr:hypothetical protein [Planctomycetia bacterium]